MNGGSSAANQTLTNTGTADASNSSKTKQTATPTQTAGSTSCWYGCGGNGQSQNVDQSSKTKQDADADAKAKQDAVNANVPVNIAGGNIIGGPNTANQTLTNTGTADASNSSKTKQTATPTQTAGSTSCWYGCGGNGQSQNVDQSSKTKQDADADAKAKQDAVNANAPLNISGGNVYGGSSAANQTATNTRHCERAELEHDDADGDAKADRRQLQLLVRLRWPRAVAERPAEGQDEAGRRRGRVGEAVPAEQRRPVRSLVRASAERRGDDLLTKTLQRRSAVRR